MAKYASWSPEFAKVCYLKLVLDFKMEMDRVRLSLFYVHIPEISLSDFELSDKDFPDKDGVVSSGAKQKKSNWAEYKPPSCEEDASGAGAQSDVEHGSNESCHLGGFGSVFHR